MRDDEQPSVLILVLVLGICCGGLGFMAGIVFDRLAGG